MSTLLNAWALSVTMNDTVSFLQVMQTHTLMYSTHALTFSHIHYTPAVAVSATSWALWCVHLLLENDCWRFSASLWQWAWGQNFCWGKRRESESAVAETPALVKQNIGYELWLSTQGSRKIFAWKSWSRLQHIYWWHICDYLLFKYFYIRCDCVHI